MPKHDDTHFDKYTEENKAKHQILGNYLPAYFHALKNTVTAFHYIDGFAGRGAYEDNIPGSPVLVLEKIAEADLLKRTSMSLVEEKPDYFKELQDTIKNNQKIQQLLDSPYMQEGRFSEHIDQILSRPVYSKLGSVATFAFVDPCGVDGVRMRDLMRLLGRDFSELLLFFNYDGVNRLIGGASKGTHDSSILVELFGSETVVKELLSSLQKINNTQEREKIIRRQFINALIANGAKYVLPFRFQAKTSARTSHYLVHCCNHCLAFKLMKHVMWDAGRTATDDYGRLEFFGVCSSGNQLELLRPDIDMRKEEILNDLAGKSIKVGDYVKQQVCKPNDVFSERVYKKMLMELETAGAIGVYDKDDVNLKTQGDRRKIKGEPTLGNSYWLRRP